MTNPKERLYDVRKDYRVFTRDGKELGQVAAVESERFRIDVPLQPDYWLRCDEVLSVIPGERVTVDFDFQEIDAHRDVTLF